MLFVPPAGSCWEHAPKAGTVWHYTEHLYALCFCATEKRNELCHRSCLLNSSAPIKKKKTHCVLCKMVLLSVSWSSEYLNIELGAKHLGCLHFKEYRMHGGNEGDGARVEIQTWIFILFFFFFRRENQPVSLGGKGAAWHTLFSSGPAILIILNKKRMLFLCVTFGTELGMGCGLMVWSL